MAEAEKNSKMVPIIIAVSDDGRFYVQASTEDRCNNESVWTCIQGGGNERIKPGGGGSRRDETSGNA